MSQMMKRAAAGAAAMVIIAAASVGALAQGAGGPGGGRRGGAGGPGGPLARGGPMAAIDLPLGQLDLTPTERDQVKSILDSHQDELKALGDKEMAARQALDKAVIADTIDEGAIRQAVSDLGAAEADSAVARAHIRAEVFQILTPDQQTKAKQLAATRPMGGRGRGRGRH